MEKSKKYLVKAHPVYFHQSSQSMKILKEQQYLCMQIIECRMQSDYDESCDRFVAFHFDYLNSDFYFDVNKWHIFVALSNF